MSEPGRTTRLRSQAPSLAENTQRKPTTHAASAAATARACRNNPEVPYDAINNPLFHPEGSQSARTRRTTERRQSEHSAETDTRKRCEAHAAPQTSTEACFNANSGDVDVITTPTEQASQQQGAEQSTGSQQSCHIHYAAPTIPSGARAAFSEVAAAALETYVATAGAGDTEHRTAQRNLMLLPAKVNSCTNGSRRRVHKVHSNIKRLNQGELQEPAPLKVAKKRAAEQKVEKGIHKQLTRGNTTRAARLLDTTEVAKPTAEVMEKLSTLHPTAVPPTVDTPEGIVPTQVTKEQLNKILKKLPKGSAPGPSGWTFEHIQTVALESERGMNATHTFLNHILTGNMQEWPEFRASRLIPLQKAGGGIRPIAIGEVWARLVSMCAMTASPDIGPGLAPLQVGVGIRGGAQCMGHAINAGVLANPDSVTLQLDAKNAFNTLSRNAMLKAVATRAPNLLPYAQWMYTPASQLHMAEVPHGSQPLWSQAGVRQGDPCGPLFFSLALQDVLQHVQLMNSDVRIIAYLDDIFIQGSAEGVVLAYNLLQASAAEIGLVMQPKKSTVYSKDVTAATTVAEMLGFEVSTEGIMAAGCPVGTEAYIAEQANGCADKVVFLIDKLMGLQLRYQDKLLLLRKSLQVKCSHLARCCDFHLIQPALHKTEQAIQTALLHIIGREEHTVDVEQLRQPTRKGGLGLQCLTAADGLVCKAGYMAAAALTQTALATGNEDFQPFKGESALKLQFLYSEISTACTCAGACKCDQMTTLTMEEAFHGNTLFGLQHAMSQRVSDRGHFELMSKYQNMTQMPGSKEQAEKHLARLLSIQHPVSTAWLNILPTKDSWNIDDATVKSALRFMLGLSPGPKGQQHFSCECRQQGGDSHHAMTCTKMSGLRTWRHNHVQNSVRCGGRTAGLTTTWEPKERHFNNAQVGEEGYGKRGDILIGMMDDWLNVDISITHPCKDTTRAKASKVAGAAAAQKARDKRSTHETEGTPGYTFVPFIVETYGRLGVDAEQLLKELADVAASTGKCDREGYLHWIRKEISLSLIRGNMKMFRQFVGSLTKSMGQNFMRGDCSAALDCI